MVLLVLTLLFVEGTEEEKMETDTDVQQPEKAENKGENEMDEGDKAQDGDNEKTSEKEQDSEVSEDTKSGNLRRLFRLGYVKL